MGKHTLTLPIERIIEGLESADEIKARLILDQMQDSVAQAMVVQEIDTGTLAGTMAGLAWGLLCQSLGPHTAYKVWAEIPRR